MDEAEVEDQEQPEAEGEKCPGDVVAVAVAPQPLGGATSFSQADDYVDAQKQDAEIHDQQYTFCTIFDNIMRMPNEEMSLAQKATAVRLAADDLAARVSESGTATKSLVERAKTFLFGSKDDRDSVFYAFKDLEGTWRWLAVATNKFRDKQGEVFPEASHKEFVEYVDRTGDYPELRVWHVPTSGIGRADMVAYADGFRIDTGVFYKGFEDVAEQLAASEEPLGISHGYRFKLKDLDSDSVYRRYRSFEDSIVPFARAANAWTEMTVERVKEVLTMPLAPEKRAFLVEKVGEERTKAIEERLPAAEKALEELGIGWKEAAAIGEAVEAEAPVPAPAPAAAPSPAPAATPAAAVPETPATPPAAEKPAEEEGEGQASLGDEVLAGVKALAEGFKTMEGTVATLVTDVAELKRTDEEKIAAKATPKAATVLGQPRPSQSPATAEGVDQDKTKEALKAADDSDEGGSPARPYVRDLMRTGATGLLNLGTAPPEPEAPQTVTPPNGG